MSIDEFDHLAPEHQNKLWIKYLRQAGIPPQPILPFLRWLKDYHE